MRPSSSPQFPGSCSRRASPLRAVSLQLESPREKLFHVYHSLTPSTHSSKTRRTRTVWKLLQTHKNQSQRLVEDLIPPCSNPPSRRAASILPPARSQHLLPGRIAAHSQICARVKPAVRKSNDSEPQNQRRRSDRAAEERMTASV